MTTRAIRITDDIAFGGDNPPLFIAGPCVIESREHVLRDGADAPARCAMS